LKEKGKLEGIIKSLTKFSEKLKVYEAFNNHTSDIKILSIKKIGPDLVVSKLWKELELKDILNSLKQKKKYSFNLERAVYLAIFQRVFCPSSDRREYLFLVFFYI
jgi:hypothetical protein